MISAFDRPGHLQRAPENFLSGDAIRAVNAGRRDFLRSSLIAATAAMTAPVVARPAQAAEGDAAVLEPQPWAISLGQPVAARPYGTPSQYESALQRRDLSIVTKAGQNSQSFAPLQGLFGIITPTGLHFERHHQGWQDMDPAKHRLMVRASSPDLINAQAFTRWMTSCVCLRFRVSTSSSAAPIPRLEWGNVLVPTVQYTHGMVSCAPNLPAYLLSALAGRLRLRQEERQVRSRGRCGRHPADTYHQHG